MKKKGNRRLKMLREFDTNTKKLVDGGFKLPEANSQVQWRDENSVYLTINTESPKRFANKLYIWERGKTVEDAKVIYQTDEYDVRIKLIERSSKLIVAKEYSAFNVVYSLLMNDKLIPLLLPVDLKDIVFVSGQLIVHLKSGWQPANVQFPSGSLISIDFESFLNGSKNFNLVMLSSHELVLDQIWNTNDILIIRALKNVQSELHEWTYDGNIWTQRKIENPQGGKIIVTKTQNSINRYYFGKVDFFSTTEYVRETNGEIKKSKELLEPIESNNYKVEQWFATSKDGTQVPYFIVHKKGILMDGNNPVIMTGYGGWGNSMLPYSLNYMTRWLEDGGVFVLANIRGGGEYGPEWHYAAIREKRQVAFDDFQGIAEDLIAKKVTSPKRIGITGTSNGGLLVTIAFIQNPQLYGAVLSRMGSIELQRCSNLSEAPPTGERGDANIPEDWAYMKTYSPFHNLESGRDYPPVLLFSNRSDDISHPCHSRKFTYRMNELGYENVYYIETSKGGHGSLDVSNREEMELAFFYKNLHPKYKEIVALEKAKN